jgi:hypothetical protein
MRIGHGNGYVWICHAASDGCDRVEMAQGELTACASAAGCTRCSARWPAVPCDHPHDRTTPASTALRGTTGVRENHTLHRMPPARPAFGGITASIASRLAQRTIRTTGVRSTSAPPARSTTGDRTRAAQRALACRSLAQRAFKIATDSYQQEGVADHLPQRPNGLAFRYRERATQPYQRYRVVCQGQS